MGRIKKQSLIMCYNNTGDRIMKRIIRILLLIFFAILLFFSTYNILQWKKENTVVKEIVEQEETRLIEAEDYHYLDEEIENDNENVVGWLIVDGTNINYPVLQYEDNEYYLNHDFNHQKNSAGWIFMDYQNKFDDQNIVIYGHHRTDGSMFGSIDNLYHKQDDKEYYISFITTTETIKYKIFSIYKIDSKDSYNELNFVDFPSKIRKFLERSEVDFHQDDLNAKQLITLSTCHDNNIDRIVVHAFR